MQSKFVRSIYLMACLSTGAAAQVPGWTQVATTGPSARFQLAMAYDSLRGKLVLFGGRNTIGTEHGDTWEWDGASWAQVATTGPGPRLGHAMAYDSWRHRVLLFGGYGNNQWFGDLWEWDGTSWTQQLSSGPPARGWHAMVYDRRRHRTVLFGGHAPSVLPGDTWEWDGTSWIRAATSGPLNRFMHAMAFDDVRAVTVLFGGVHPSLITLADTWEWDGSAWIQFGGGGPSARGSHAMAFDGGNVLLFGGLFQGSGTTFPVSGQTWAWNGISWSQSTLAGPGPRFDHAMAYDGVRGRTLLFGGYGPGGGDTWEWNGGFPGNVAFAAAYGAGCGSQPLVFQPNPAARPIVGRVAKATIVNAPTSLAGVSIGLSNQFFGVVPLPMTLAGLGMPGCDLWQSGEFFGFGTSPLAPSSLEFSLSIPNTASAIGFRCYLQSCAFAPGQNPLSIVVSNGIEWRFGSL